MQDALAGLSIMDAQLQALGAVDSEREQIASLRERLLSGDLSPEIATAKAQAILDARSEYH